MIHVLLIKNVLYKYTQIMLLLIFVGKNFVIAKKSYNALMLGIFHKISLKKISLDSQGAYCRKRAKHHYLYIKHECFPNTLRSGRGLHALLTSV